MFSLLLIIPMAAIVSGVLIYGRSGKRDFLKFDLVQFVYAFLLAPLLFVWMKSFLFYLLRQEFDVRLSLNEIFILDTMFSVLSIYIYSFIVIHSLTKSFELKRYVDPLYDVFSHAEALHLWISHTGMYVGGMIIFSIVSLTNVFLPAEIEMNRNFFYFSLGLGLLSGIFAFAGMWMSNFTEKPTFLKILKLSIAFCLTAHVAAYFIVDPSFGPSSIIYWTVFMAFLAAGLCSYVFERSEKASSWFERFHHKKGWNWKSGNFLRSKSKFKL